MENPTILNLKNNLTELIRIQQTMEALGEYWNVPFQMVVSLNLIIEEVFANIVLHAFPDQSEQIIQLKIGRKDDCFGVEFLDLGIHYNPVCCPGTSPDCLCEEGLTEESGVKMIKQVMDEVSYVRNLDTNRLKMCKKIW